MVRIFRPSFASLLGSFALFGLLGLLSTVVPTRHRAHPDGNSGMIVALMMTSLPLFGIMLSKYVYKLAINFDDNAFIIVSGWCFLPTKKSYNLRHITTALETQRAVRGSSSLILVFRERDKIIGRIEPGLNGWTEQAIREIHDIFNSRVD